MVLLDIFVPPSCALISWTVKLITNTFLHKKNHYNISQECCVIKLSFAGLRCQFPRQTRLFIIILLWLTKLLPGNWFKSRLISGPAPPGSDAASRRFILHVGRVHQDWPRTARVFDVSDGSEELIICQAAVWKSMPPWYARRECQAGVCSWRILNGTSYKRV